MGLGRFGGGVGVTNFLVEQGAHVLVTDTLPPDELADSTARIAVHIESGSVTLRLGEHREQDFTDADLVVVNPAVNPATNPYVQAAITVGVPLTSEIRLLVDRLPTSRVIAVTGTAGKSTTVSMIHHVLSDTLGSDRAWLGGNIGGSLLPSLPDIRPDHHVVLELSSFMLDGLRHNRWSPHIAVVTNIHPNHLDWHGTYTHYTDAKQQILEHQNAHDIAILGSSCAGLLHPRTPRTLWSDTSWVQAQPLPDLLVLGDHNRANARLAIEALAQAGFDRNASARSLASFGGLRHRLCTIGLRDDIRFIDDSKSTTPQAAILAIKAVLDDLPDAAIHVILGGYDKGSDLREMARFAGEHTASILAIGQTAQAITQAAQGLTAHVSNAQTLDTAVTQAISRASAGDVILLSPGCASWDQFANYEARGHAFALAAGL